MLVVVILMLIGFITPRVAPSLALSLGVILTLCYVVGLLLLIVGAIRRSHEKKKGLIPTSAGNTANGLSAKLIAGVQIVKDVKTKKIKHKER